MENVMNIYEGVENRQVSGRGVGTEMMVSRQAQEVQAAMVIAKKFPRNEVESFNRIMQACKRRSLAEQAMYEYPRGTTKVTGPSIRLAEAMAQNWGNIDFGITELEQRSGESQVMAYAWDLETNTRQTKIFAVPHVRSTKQGNKVLTDPRDIYEMIANQGARRLRACILGVIPGDVIDAAIAQCEATLTDSNGGVPLEDLIRSSTATLQEKYGITIPMIEAYIGCNVKSFTMNDLMRLKRVYKSLEDGMAKREDCFDLSDHSQDAAPEVNNPFEKDSGKPSGKKKAEKAKEAEKPQAEAGTQPPDEIPETPFR